MTDTPNEPGQDLAEQLAGQMTPEVSRFVGTVAGASRIEIGELAAEEIRSFRFKRHIKHVKKAMQQLEEAGLEPRQVPVRVLAPLMDGATLEDDEELSAKWAALLANAAAGSQNVPAAFAYILRELEPGEARLLDYLYRVAMRIAPELRRVAGVSGPHAAERLELTTPALHFALDNLIRLRLADAPGDPHKWDDVVTLTEFGRAFVRACLPPSEPDPEIKYTTQEQVNEISRENREKRAKLEQDT